MEVRRLGQEYAGVKSCENDSVLGESMRTGRLPMTHPSSEALKACANWLVYCLQLGWKKEQLDILEKIWWEHHDDNGRLE